MKLAIRAFALLVIVAGFAAASVSSTTSKTVASHQSASASFPIPGCGPFVPCATNNAASAKR